MIAPAVRLYDEGAQTAGAPPFYTLLLDWAARGNRMSRSVMKR